MKINFQPFSTFVFFQGVLLAGIITVAGCAAPKLKPMPVVQTKTPVIAETRSVAPPPEKSSSGGDGTSHTILKASGFSQEGWASWYGKKFHGRLTASQEVYNMHALTAAHKTLPFETRVMVTNLDNDRAVVVRINDRGPFVKDRIIDLSYQAGKELGMLKQGMTRVRLSALAAPPGEKVFRETGKGYTIQLGVFKSQENARQASKKFEDGRIQTFLREDRPLHRVLAGSFRSLEDAVARMDEILSSGPTDAFIIIEP